MTGNKTICRRITIRSCSRHTSLYYLRRARWPHEQCQPRPVVAAHSRGDIWASWREVSLIRVSDRTNLLKYFRSTVFVSLAYLCFLLIYRCIHIFLVYLVYIILWSCFLLYFWFASIIFLTKKKRLCPQVYFNVSALLSRILHGIFIRFHPDGTGSPCLQHQRSVSASLLSWPTQAVTLSKTLRLHGLTGCAGFRWALLFLVLHGCTDYNNRGWNPGCAVEYTRYIINRPTN